MREEIAKELDFIGDHWVKGDDRPPFNYGGWRDECLDKIIELVNKETETFEDKIVDIMGEFGDQPEQCLSIIGDLIGQRQHFRRHPNAPRVEELT